MTPEEIRNEIDMRVQNAESELRHKVAFELTPIVRNLKTLSEKGESDPFFLSTLIEALERLGIPYDFYDPELSMSKWENDLLRR